MAEVVLQPKAEVYGLADLVRLTLAGRIRIPRFQRSFRWDSRDVVKLFDSLLLGYPVGSVLLWGRRAPQAHLTIGAVEVDAPATSDALWVVDGQQRITTLVNGVSPEAYERSELFRLDYDIARHKIVRAKDADPALSIPLPTLFDLRWFLEWFQSRPELADRAGELNDVAARIREFKIPASIVMHDDEAVLRDIFDRMNNTGRRLRRAEVFNALNAEDEDGAHDTLTISVIGDQVAVETGFGAIDQDTALRAILVRRHPDVTRDVRLEFSGERRRVSDFPDEDRDAAFAAGSAALLKAVEFLQREAGVPHFSFLPYRYQLIALSRFFGLFPQPHPRNVALLVHWFWRSSLASTIFKGSATGMVRAFAGRIHAGDETGSVKALLSTIPDETLLQWPDLARFRTNEAATRVILCAMYDAGPRSFVDGHSLDISDVAAITGDASTAIDIAREIVPRRLLGSPMSYSAANRFLVADDDAEQLPREILAGGIPLGMNEVLAHEIRRSHLVTDEAAGFLAAGDHPRFLAARRVELQERLTGFLRVRMGFDYLATPPLRDLDLDNLEDISLGPRDDMLDGGVGAL